MKKSSLTITSYIVSILFALLILYPLIYIISNSMKDNVKIYDIPPKLLPDTAQSLTIEMDYSAFEHLTDEQLLDKIQQDQILAMFSSVYELTRDSLFELKFVGTMNGEDIFYSRAHRMKLELEKDTGVYANASINRKVLLYEDRYIRASNKIGYTFDRNGIQKAHNITTVEKDEIYDKVSKNLADKYETNGVLKGTKVKKNNLLLLESFIYYFQLPSWMYPKNEVVAKYSFLIFIINTLIVVSWAIITQVVLGAITAFPLSRMLSKKAANFWLLFFLGTTMIPFVSVMIPQFTMFKRLGFYDNYWALLVPHLLPYGFFVYLYKGFFDRIPSSLFEAARIDGASNLYTFTKICMPLSKPIISIVALQTFLSNWSDFFWAWMVTERQNLWTLNVALYNISQNKAVKQNFVMGLSVLTILPVLFLTVIFSKHIKASLASSGIKG
ncbi:carbohydrate ABC transporter permease [Niameybacter massiliensis]|uniref:carbohydrate ABC transporter permease n=1 Tax=Niameybacter massiliensis TaxID=1658108 RepID=UPI0006B602CD|nr:carbohydrate ABC transporter permease [Niameybacter massiliensis]